MEKQIEKAVHTAEDIRNLEQRRLSMDFLDTQFAEAFDRGMDEVRAKRATVHLQYRDGIQDQDHMEHATITAMDGTILYDQDFVLERALKKQYDPEDN